VVLGLRASIRREISLGMFILRRIPNSTFLWVVDIVHC
jgi:hypothetical protein